MRRVIHFARRNKFLILATALLMIGAGCVGAAREAGDQLTEDAMKPITVPVEVYQRATEVASSTEARARLMIDQAGGLNQ
ncbi:MAG: hypothetical protein QY323_00640 [Patescibacteria group bacterium]|nr:MAG: hypothetical protein QY323_00640 [Patescibacteria group bacterium]